MPSLCMHKFTIRTTIIWNLYIYYSRYSIYFNSVPFSNSSINISYIKVLCIPYSVHLHTNMTASQYIFLYNYLNSISFLVICTLGPLICLLLKYSNDLLRTYICFRKMETGMTIYTYTLICWILKLLCHSLCNIYIECHALRSIDLSSMLYIVVKLYISVLFILYNGGITLYS